MATSSSTSAGCAANGFRSDDRALAVGTGLSDRDPPSGGAGRTSSEHRAATGRSSPQHASWRRAGFRLCMLLRTWSPSNGDVGSLSVATSTARSVGSAHVRRESRRVSVASRSGPGSSEHEPTLSNRPTRHLCRGGGSCASESRGRKQSATWWLPKRGEGRSRPEPNPSARSNRCGAQAPQRRGGASGERRES